MLKLFTSLKNYTDDQTIKLFRNALFDTKQRQRSREVLAAIAAEWKRRGKNSPDSASNSWPDQGVLDVLGYNVGFAKGRPERERRLILDYVLNRQLPFVHSRKYMAQWGVPGSEMRSRKLMNSLTGFKNSVKKPSNYVKALAEWDADIKYLESIGATKWAS